MKWIAAARWSGLRLLLYPTCVDALQAANESPVQLSAAVGSFDAKRADGKIPSSSFAILTSYQHFIRAQRKEHQRRR
ncbi:MAG: hypothetical protein Udaeo2_32920 [Candidatus Udaeobacter sp.]|nr:MAG: hypothetical protein Udaeo2_32920 [Candidatus Udaeobacter sp.]